MPRLRTTGTTSPLPARRAACPSLNEPLHTCIGVILGLLDPARVNDVDYIWDGDGSLGHIGRHDDLAPRGGQEDQLLLGARQICVQRQNLYWTEICRLQLGDALANLHDSGHEHQDGALVRRGRDMFESGSDKAIVDAVRR